MNRTFSTYLDIVRILAAGFVVYAHSNLPWLLNDKLPLVEFSHSAVLVFFVLSGYVIAFVSDQKEKLAHEYVASRASRILSLSIAVVFLTPFLDSLGRSVSPEYYSGTIPNDYWFLRIAASLTFLTEAWLLSIMSFSNGPYWSLSYEVWYYALFGFYHYSNGRTKWLGISVVCLIVGPKILLLAPPWLVGVAIYRWKVDENWPWLLALILWILSIYIFVGFHYFDLMKIFGEGLRELIGNWLFVRLSGSKYFGADWLLSTVIAVNFLAARRVFKLFNYLPPALTKGCGRIGNLTYALYITHCPLLYFWSAILGSHEPSWIWYGSIVVLSVLSAMAIGLVGEWLRPRFRIWIRKILSDGTIGRLSLNWFARAYGAEKLRQRVPDRK